MNGLEMKYFVLKPKGSDKYAAASRRAMRVYATFIQNENPELAHQLRDWADREQVDAIPDEASHEQIGRAHV